MRGQSWKSWGGDVRVMSVSDLLDVCAGDIEQAMFDELGDVEDESCDGKRPDDVVMGGFAAEVETLSVCRGRGVGEIGFGAVMRRWRSRSGCAVYSLSDLTIE